MDDLFASTMKSIFSGDGMQAASAILSVFGADRDSRNRETEAAYNSAVASQNAISERMWAQAAATRLEREAKLRRGGNIASAGASGIVANTGSLLDLMADDDTEALLDRQFTVAAAESRARASESQSLLFRRQASAIRRNRPITLLGRATEGLAPIFTRKQ